MKENINRRTFVTRGCACGALLLAGTSQGLSETTEAKPPSYTTFKYGNPSLEKDTIRKNETGKVSVDVTNTGKPDGDEVVQMYVRQQYSSVTRPVKELKGFKRIHLRPGETRTVEFEITPEKLSFYNINMDYTVEPGGFEIMGGTSSEDNKTALLTVTN